MNKLTYEEAHRFFRYDPESGWLFWRVSPCRRVKAGDEAGCARSNHRTHYLGVQVRRKTYLVHRVVWLMFYGKWPENDIDHIDGDGLNNRVENLRDVPGAVNNRNARMKRNNTSGVNGVSFHKQTGKWRAQSCDRGKKKHLGRYTDLADAERAVREFQALLGFSERHGKDGD